MTQTWITGLMAVGALLIGVALRFLTDRFGDVPMAVCVVLVLATFAYIFAKTRFYAANYTSGLTRLQNGVVLAIAGFNLGALLER